MQNIAQAINCFQGRQYFSKISKTTYGITAQNY